MKKLVNTLFISLLLVVACGGQKSTSSNTKTGSETTTKRTFAKLLDYEVRIPPGGKTDALVETTVTWDYPLANGISNLTTTGVDSDQMVAAIIATEKMLNLLMQKQEKK